MESPPGAVKNRGRRTTALTGVAENLAGAPAVLVAAIVLAMLPGTPAQAERFRILEGERHDEASGTPIPLAGTLVLEPGSDALFPPPGVDFDSFHITQFDLRSGSEHFTAYQPPVHEGISPGLAQLRLLDSLALDGESFGRKIFVPLEHNLFGLVHKL